MNDVQITLVSRKTILSVSVLTWAQSGIPTFTLCIPTTTMSHVGPGQPVYARVALATLAFAFVMLREDTAGFSVASNPCGQAMELYCIGSGSISILKSLNKQSSTSRRDSALHTWAAGHSTLLDSSTGLASCSRSTALIRAASRRR